MSESQTRPSVGTFRRIVEAIHERFVYVTDSKQYGVLDRWDELREVAGGKLAGDCEDFCITVANRCAAAGVPLEDLTLYLVAVKDGPDHVVIGCRGWIADCNEREVKERMRRSFYFRWVSERNLGGGTWQPS